jgi:hypothetical protein
LHAAPSLRIAFRLRCVSTENELLLESIEKDIVRTNPDHPFFNSNAQVALTCILFVYAKMNSGVSYVQVFANGLSFTTFVYLILRA